MLRIVWLVGVLLALPGGLAHATQSVLPERALSEPERLELGILGADVVFVGNVVSVRDSSVRTRTGGRSERFRIVDCRTLRACKGTIPAHRIRFVVWPDVVTDDPYGHPGPVDGRPFWSPGRRVLVLLADLSRGPRAPAATPTGAAQGLARWATYDTAGPLSIGGALSATPDLEREVSGILKSQGPASLVASSTRIVLGRMPSWLLGRGHDHEVAVERTLKGPSAPVLNVRLVLPDRASGAAEALLFLREVAPGLYEPRPLGAGFLPVRDGWVPAWDCSVSVAIRRIEALSR